MTKTKKSRFRRGLLIYTLMLLIVACAALFIFYAYISAYENARPNHSLEVYRASLSETLPKAAEEALASLDPRVHSPEENAQWAKDLLSQVKATKLPTLSEEEKYVYALKTDDGQQVGTITLAVTGTGNFRFPQWEVTEESFDFSPYFQTREIAVPADYTVTLNGQPLGPDDVADSRVPYQLLQDCYADYPDLPYLTGYAFGPYVGEEAVLGFFDEQGQELAPEELTEDRFLGGCSAEDREAIDAFIPDFLYNYIYYSADVNGGAMGYYGALNALVVPEGQLQTRLRQAIGSFGWSNTHGLEILSTEIRSVKDLGEGRFLVDVGYETIITALNGPVNVSDQALVLLVNYQGTLLADAVYHY